MTSQVSKFSKPKQQDGNQSPETAPMVGTPETSNLLDVTEGQKSSRLMWFLCFASTFVQSDGCEDEKEIS